MMRDRVQKLETRLVESKKKLAEANSCKPSFKYVVYVIHEYCFV